MVKYTSNRFRGPDKAWLSIFIFLWCLKIHQRGYTFKALAYFKVIMFYGKIHYKSMRRDWQSPIFKIVCGQMTQVVQLDLKEPNYLFSAF